MNYLKYPNSIANLKLVNNPMLKNKNSKKTISMIFIPDKIEPSIKEKKFEKIPNFNGNKNTYIYGYISSNNSRRIHIMGIYWKTNLYLYIILYLFFYINSSSISIIIKGPGEQSIFYGGNICSERETFFSQPNDVYINGNKQTDVRDKYVLNGTTNYVKLEWNDIINNCNCLFRDCTSIINVDFSDFNFSIGLKAHMMFMNCLSLTSVNFHSSGKINMLIVSSMFQSCESLSFVNLTMLNMSRITDMSRMFRGCHSLISLNLPNFRNTNMEKVQEMFYDCPNLEYINLPYFHICNSHTNSTNFISASKNLIFCSGCYVISNLVNKGCSKIVCSNDWRSYQNKINLENGECIDNCFSTNNNKYTYMSKCYEICPDGTYNNINNYTCEECHPDCKTCDKPAEMNNTNCKSCFSDKFLKYGNCVSNCKNGYYEDENNPSIKICKCDLIKCYICSQESLNQNLCITCNNENGYYQKYDELNNINNFIDCYKNPEGYYLDTNNNNEPIYKLCYETCKFCYIKGNETYHYCIECKPNYYFELISNGYKNCYDNCSYYHYYDNNSNIYYCTKTFQCPENYNKLIHDKNECVKTCDEDNEYKYEFRKGCYKECPTGSKKPDNNSSTNQYYCDAICPEDKPFEIISTQECVKNCPTVEIEQNICILKYKMDNQDENKSEEEKAKILDILINNIEEDFISKDYNTAIIDKGHDIVFPIGNMKMTLTTTKNQKYNTNNNITLIDFGECESLLREEYHIPNDELLYMKKIDVYDKEMQIPKVEYDVYSKLNGSNLVKLNLTVCKSVKISIFLPYTMPENLDNLKEELDKLNSSSGYYNDICYTASSESGTDISLKDRREKFVNNNKAVCQEDCDFSEYDSVNKRVKCSCKPKECSESTINMKINKTKLYEKFTDINNIANIKIMKCYKVLFSKKGIKSNIACFTIIPIIIFHIIVIFIYYCNQKDNLKKKIEDISYAIKNWYLIEAEDKEKMRIAKRLNMRKIDITKKNSKLLKNNIMITSNKINKKHKKVKLPSPVEYLFILKMLNNKKYNPPIKIRSKAFYNTRKSNKRSIRPKFNFANSSKKIIQTINNNNKIKKIREIMAFTDGELNKLSYKLAKRFDKRTYWEYYLSLLKTNHIFVFSFIYNNDYNVKIIKIDLFFISFVISYTINALFFNDDTMHKIYEDEGSFNFIYQLPQILYSSMISMVFDGLLQLLALSEGNILALKNKKENINMEQRLKNLYYIINTKFIFYFIISTILLLVFWYYLSMFGAIYKNTQLHLIKDTLISFGTSLLYPFGIYLIPGIFRITALSNIKKKKICLYNFSLILQRL